MIKWNIVLWVSVWTPKPCTSHNKCDFCLSSENLRWSRTLWTGSRQSRVRNWTDPWSTRTWSKMVSPSASMYQSYMWTCPKLNWKGMYILTCNSMRKILEIHNCVKRRLLACLSAPFVWKSFDRLSFSSLCLNSLEVVTHTTLRLFTNLSTFPYGQKCFPILYFVFLYI